MSRGEKRLLYWAPRGLGIAFAVFISLFALHVFGEGYGFPDVVVAFLIHLVPTYLVLIALAIAWRWEWVGAAVFWALGAFYIWLFRGDFDPVAFLLISGPLFLTGGLFLVNWIYRDQLKQPSQEPEDAG